MTLKEAIETTPTGFVKNDKFKIHEQCLVTLLGHVHAGNIKLSTLLRDDWEWEMKPELGTEPYNGWRLTLAKLYLKRQNVL
mgnify:CR=1 FL=1